MPQGPLGPLSELKSHGFDTLLQDLFWDLKVCPRPTEAGAQEWGWEEWQEPGWHVEGTGWGRV